MPEICEAEKRPVLKAFDVEKNEYILYQPRCKRWSCKPCANINRLLWMAKIGYGYEHYCEVGVFGWRMLTITAHENCTNFAQCLYPFKHQWSLLSSRMRRKHPKFKYAILPECHEDGRVHWHMISSGNIKPRWLKDNARECGLGYETDSKQIRKASSAIGYVTKYISKAIYEVKWPDKLKRIRTSQKWPELPPENEEFVMDVDWYYYLSYPAEGMSFLAHELERDTGIRTRVL
jgi:hypothetical protein